MLETATNDLPTSAALGWILTTLVAVAIAINLRGDITRLVSARNVVLLSVFSWYLFEALQMPSAVSRYGQAAIDFGLVLVGLSTWAFLQGYSEVQTRTFDTVGRHITLLDDRRHQWRLLLLGGMIGFFPVVLYGGTDLTGLFEGILGMRRTWGGPLARGTLGDFRAALLTLEVVIWGVSWLAMIFLLDRRNPPGARMFALLLVTWSLIRAYGSGTRSLFLTVLLVPCAAMFWKAPWRWQKRMVWMTPLVGIVFYGLAAAMVVGRPEGNLVFGSRPNYVGHEMFRELLFIVKEVPANRDYLWGTSYFRELISPIPRFLWPDKPHRFGVEFAAWQGSDALAGGATLSPGIIGEMFANFGILGVVGLSFLGGALARAWDRLRLHYADSLCVMMFYSAGLAALFMSGRSATLSAFYPMITAYLLLVVITGIRRRRSRLRARNGDASGDEPFETPRNRPFAPTRGTMRRHGRLTS